ncbi:MAG: DNA adenine methylase [Planctomycetota bacterium]|jgi:adenine-specific DNA-methyltransferase
MGLKQVDHLAGSRLHHPKRHAAVRTDEYIFAQLIPYIGNKRKLLHLIAEATEFTGIKVGTFVDLFTGSTVVARWAKKQGYRTVANDWEPYSHEIAQGTVALNAPPSYEALGGREVVFGRLNSLAPVEGYVATHLCPANDEAPDPACERMFFTRANGMRIDAIREQVDQWESGGLLSEGERAYLLAPLLYAVSYASNTSGVFKGFHNGWGGKTGTALYRILRELTITPPPLWDNGQQNVAVRADAHELADRLPELIGGIPDIVYLDPPYNQHPYGSNYHVLNTVTLWDKPPVNPSILVDGRLCDKSAIRKDWRTERRSAYNSRKTASAAFGKLVGRLQCRWALVSYSTDGNIPLRELLQALAERGRLHVFTAAYKRYRVSTPRMSPKSHNVEFVAAVDFLAKPSVSRVDELIEGIYQQELQALGDG